MNETELQKRNARAMNETLVISQTEGGFRVYNPANITHLYMVSGVPDLPQCTCPDFQAHQSDPEWHCKHILAVLNQTERTSPDATTPENHEAEERKAIQEELKAPEKKERKPRNGTSQMVIKRSVSPDGRIDSLSVEFSSPIHATSDEDIKQRAHRALVLQAEITTEFLKGNGNGRPKPETTEKTASDGNANGQTRNRTNEQGNNSEGSVPAQLLNVGGMNTRGGWKLFINVQVNGTTTKLFGTKRQLGDHVAAAGFAGMADHVNQGMMLNVPCRVTTTPSPDGKYLNIERVLPIGPLDTTGRAR